MTTSSGWEETTLGELGRYLNGRAIKKSEWAQSGRPIIRIQNLTGSTSTVNYFEGEVEDRYVVRPGDLLVSWAATLGAYFWSGPEGVLNQHIFKVESRIDRRFHKYLLDFKLAELMQHTHGSGMVHITRGRFDAVPVSVPDLPTQRRIVEILEDHLSRLDAAAEAVAVANRRASALVTSTASALVDRTRLSGTEPLGTYALSVTYGTSAKAHASASEADLPVLRMGNLQDGQLDWTSLKYLPSTHPDILKASLEPGDLLFNRTNSAELVGKSAVFHGERPATLASYLIRVRFDDRVLSDWANLVINSPYGRRYISSVASQQVGQANVNGKKLKAFPLPVPPIPEQASYLDEFSAAVDAADGVRRTCHSTLKRCASLRRSVLAAAFSGKLTGRHTDDEVVEELAEAMA